MVNFFFFFWIRCTKKNGDAVNGSQFKLKLRDYLFFFKYYFTLVMYQSPVHIFPILTIAVVGWCDGAG